MASGMLCHPLISGNVSVCLDGMRITDHFIKCQGLFAQKAVN